MGVVRKQTKRALERGVEFGATRVAWLLTRKIRADRWASMMVDVADDREVQARKVVGSVTAALAPNLSDVFAMFLQGYVLFGRGPAHAEKPAQWIWHRPPARAIIDQSSAHVPSRVRAYARNSGLTFRENVDGPAVLQLCQADRNQEWLTDDLCDVYQSGIASGLTYTASAYRDGAIVACVFGVKIGTTFCLMSMHHSEDKAGSILMAWLVDQLSAGAWTAIDCGDLKPNFVRYGAVAVPVQEFSDRMLAGVLGQGAESESVESEASPSPQAVRA